MDKFLSPNEEKIVEIIGRKKVTITEITKEMYPKNPPLNAATTVANAIRRINFKCKHLKQKWFINGEGMGRNGKTVWKDKK